MAGVIAACFRAVIGRVSLSGSDAQADFYYISRAPHQRPQHFDDEAIARPFTFFRRTAMPEMNCRLCSLLAVITGYFQRTIRFRPYTASNAARSLSCRFHAGYAAIVSSPMFHEVAGTERESASLFSS